MAFGVDREEIGSLLKEKYLWEGENNYLLFNHTEWLLHMPDTVPGPGKLQRTKPTNKTNPCSHGTYFLVGETDNNKWYVNSHKWSEK